MDSPQATRSRDKCELHPDRAAVGNCERCGRTVCLDCAIPFKGAIRCERCAAIELGEPAPVEAAKRRRLGARHLALLLLLVALAATVPAWHRSGTLTTLLSAWTFNIEPTTAAACLSLGLATVLVLAAAIRAERGRRALAAGTILTLGALIGISLTLIRAPEFFSSTAAPFVALASTVAATLVEAFALLRRGRP